jgi:AraC-like DNA-binding protein
MGGAIDDAGSPPKCLARERWALEVETANWEFVVNIGQNWTDKIVKGQELLLAGKSVEQASLELGFGSTRTFRKAFTRHTGSAPVEWAVKNERTTLIRRRVREAEDLLSDTNATMAEIAKRTGFANPANFTNGFRKVHGVTPTEWRKRKREGI